jgi:hypothetical protein
VGGPCSGAAAGLHYPEWLEENNRASDASPSEFKLISYFFTRVT